MTTADVVPFSSGTMTEAVYQRERDVIRAAYGDGSTRQARAAADQALAALFARSGWTQDRLAQKEKQSQPYIAQRMAFGQFLAFIANAINPDFDLVRPKLTEGKFRDYWKRTNDIGNIQRRWQRIRDMLIEDLRIEASRLNKSPVIPTAIKKLADGTWHREATIVKHAQDAGAATEPPVDVSADDVRAVLQGILQKKTHGLTGERRKGATGWSYKLLHTGRRIELEVFMAEVGPILEGLKSEGKKNMATMSPGTVAHLAFQLERLIEKWSSQ